MATISTNLTDAVYVELTTAADALVTLESVGPVRVVFALSLPVVDSVNYLTLNNESRGVVKVGGHPVGNIYARAVGSAGATVAVS